MRGCGIPRGFWLKPGGSVDRVEGIIIETFVILCQYNSQIHQTILFFSDLWLSLVFDSFTELYVYQN
jgi:hypothetical protein